MNEKIKEMMMNLFGEMLKNGVDSFMKPEAKPEEPKQIASAPQIATPGIIPVISELISVEPAKRIFKVSNNLYYARGIKMTTWCNAEDFKGDVYQFAPGSRLSKAYKGKMKGVRGISLSYPINTSLIAYPINPKNGYMFAYGQVDVGPGYTKDHWWVNGTNPLNESGFDMLGHISPKSGLDALPQVFEDLGICTFEEAYNGSVSAIIDLLIYEPTVMGSKIKGNEIPSSDGRQWLKDLPNTGSEHFTWGELLRGWNRAERPSNEQITNLLALVKDILHPTRTVVGELHVGSALRDPETNVRVGGRDGSLHLVGRAADLNPKNMTCTELYKWMTANLNTKVRENVLEDVGNSNEHLHVAGPIRSGETNNTHIKDS